MIIVVSLGWWETLNVMTYVQETMTAMIRSLLLSMWRVSYSTRLPSRRPFTWRVGSTLLPHAWPCICHGSFLFLLHIPGRFQWLPGLSGAGHQDVPGDVQRCEASSTGGCPSRAGIKLVVDDTLSGVLAAAVAATVTQEAGFLGWDSTLSRVSYF